MYKTTGGGKCWSLILVAIVTVPFVILHVHVVLDLSYILCCLMIWTFVFWLNGIRQFYMSAIDGVVVSFSLDISSITYSVVGS